MTEHLTLDSSGKLPQKENPLFFDELASPWRELGKKCQNLLTAPLTKQETTFHIRAVKFIPTFLAETLKTSMKISLVSLKGLFNNKGIFKIDNPRARFFASILPKLVLCPILAALGIVGTVQIITLFGLLALGSLLVRLTKLILQIPKILIELTEKQTKIFIAIVVIIFVIAIAALLLGAASGALPAIAVFSPLCLGAMLGGLAFETILLYLLYKHNKKHNGKPPLAAEKPASSDPQVKQTDIKEGAGQSIYTQDYKTVLAILEDMIRGGSEEDTSVEDSEEANSQEEVSEASLVVGAAPFAEANNLSSEEDPLVEKPDAINSGVVEGQKVEVSDSGSDEVSDSDSDSDYVDASDFETDLDNETTIVTNT